MALLEGYDGRGKDKVTVADELVDRAIEMGFLSEGGRVSFSIDAPDEVLFQEYGIELRTGITEHLDGRIMVTIELAASGAGGAVTESSITPESSAESSAPVSSAEPAEPAIVPSAPADTDYGPGNDGVTDYSDTDYGAGSDGVTDYSPSSADSGYGGDSGYADDDGDDSDDSDDDSDDDDDD